MICAASSRRSRWRSGVCPGRYSMPRSGVRVAQRRRLRRKEKGARDFSSADGADDTDTLGCVEASVCVRFSDCAGAAGCTEVSGFLLFPESALSVSFTDEKSLSVRRSPSATGMRKVTVTTFLSPLYSAAWLAVLKQSSVMSVRTMSSDFTRLLCTAAMCRFSWREACPVQYPFTTTGMLPLTTASRWLCSRSVSCPSCVPFSRQGT